MTLARFTPSILPGETLEQLFVHRHHLLDDVLGAVHEAANGDGRRHRLFVGPRGAGKTHLISLVNHRVQQARADGLRVGLSWLMEDPWEVETYDDLISELLDGAGADPSGGEKALLRLVANDGPMVVLIENLDQVLEQIAADGQRRFRALMENERPLLVIATSTRLSEDLSEQNVPFYGFFDNTQLEPFSVDQAADMLRHLADYSEDESLAAVLVSKELSSRLATIAHLAGGQPRVWALLATGLSDSGIDDMVEMLLARFDDLTPYYQEQLARLSPSERKAVRRLADADRLLTVRDLAIATHTDQKSMSKTVSDLRKRGWVRRHNSILTAKVDARNTYYELAEPLARIAFQMKTARGEPVRLAVDFLATWFADIPQVNPERADTPAARYVAAAADRQTGSMRVAQLLAAEPRWKAPPSARRQQAFADLLSELDDAIVDFEAGSPDLLLQQPAHITRLIEKRLEHGTVLDLRLALGRVAVVTGNADRWQPRLDDILADVSGDAVWRAVLLAIAVSGEVGTELEFDLYVDRLISEMNALELLAVQRLLAEAYGVADWFRSQRKFDRITRLCRPLRHAWDRDDESTLDLLWVECLAADPRAGKSEVMTRDLEPFLMRLFKREGQRTALAMSARFQYALLLRYSEPRASVAQFELLLADEIEIFDASDGRMDQTRALIAEIRSATYGRPKS